ncbi:F-box/kelch-repeat protein [Forsythia ovata]|uniref:F-box/kelch-repeat protein n=1 Tax=Forsythia ovata TaxID=205694 RepID=A0ABD1V0L7_9LAMI
MASEEQTNPHLPEGTSGVNAQDSMPLPFLPQELIFDIISRLPVKSLVQFRCVCKSWLSLISSPEFAKTHLKISSEKNRGEPDSLAFGRCTEHGVTLHSCNLDSFMHETKSINAAEIYGDTMVSSLWMIGSINGLICLSVRPNEIFLWNPSIRKSKALPPSGFHCGQYSFVSTYGFGYDSLNDDYKVVETFGFMQGYEYIAEVKIYSLRTNSWRSIESWPRTFISGSSCVFINGAFHWPGRSQRPWHMTSLNLVTEMYEEVPMPRYDPVSSLSNLSLGVLRGRLCVFCKYNTHLDVWMMNEYGVGKSWTRMACAMDVENYGYDTPLPLYVSEGGVVVMDYGSTLKLYNSSDNTSNFQENSPAHLVSYLGAVTYIESLVLPNFDPERNQQLGQWGTKCMKCEGYGNWLYITGASGL